MKDWQINAIEALLAPIVPDGEGYTYREINTNSCYLHSGVFGTQRKHLIEVYQFSRDLKIDQIDADEKYDQHVLIETAEVPVLLAWLLQIHLAQRQAELQAWNATSHHDALGDLDDHPF